MSSAIVCDDCGKGKNQSEQGQLCRSFVGSRVTRCDGMNVGRQSRRWKRWYDWRTTLKYLWIIWWGERHIDKIFEKTLLRGILASVHSRIKV